MTKRKMFGISKDLDEGISQTINAVKNNVGQLRYEIIPLTKIKFDPHNPRRLALEPSELRQDFVPSATDPLAARKRAEWESLQSLATSIQKQGVRHAVEVYKDGVDYRLISGERRVLGSLLAGKEDVQARVLDDKPSEFDIRYLQWIENIEREDLSIWERIGNIQQVVLAYTNRQPNIMTASTLKDILGCSLPHAMTYLAVLNAPEDVQVLLQSNRLANLEKAAFLAKVADETTRQALTIACVEKNASLATLRKLLQDSKRKPAVSVSKTSKQGRTAARVALGFTQNKMVVKQVMESIVAQPGYSQYRALVVGTDWQDYASVGRAFQMLIRMLEKQSY